MTRAASEERFRQSAEAEGGTSVSAGARVAHIRMAAEAGRAFYVDLSAIAEEERSGVIAQINELVNKAAVRAPSKGLNSAQGSSRATG